LREPIKPDITLAIRFNKEKLIKLREANGLTQTDLDLKLDLSFGYTWRLETGRFENPRLCNVVKIARCFNVPIEELVIEDQIQA